MSSPAASGGSQSSPSLANSRPHSALNLDLSSSQATVHSRNADPVTIQIGGVLQNGSIVGSMTQVINPGQLLTPAQFMAVNEVLRGGQTLLLNGTGQAIGGYATLNSSRVHQLGSIVVPQNVVLDAIGFNANSPLNVSGNANIAGSMYALQSTPNVSAVLQFGNLNIGSGGLLSTNLPAGFNLGSNVFSSGGMTLNVANNVTNLGSIATAGNLNLNVGGTLSNINAGSLPALITGQNINLNVGSGHLVNSGLIQSLNNLNINGPNTTTDLNINGADGVFKAINGSINLRDISFSGTGNTNITGGDWLSKELNFNSGQGAVTASMGQVSGVVNADAGAAHIYTKTSNLLLGNTNINGDPTYVNAGGDIQLVGTDFETEDLAIIASGNITANGPAQIINNGHNVWLIAGANIDTASGACVGCGNSTNALTLPSGSASPITGGLVQVSAAGGTGGDIDLQTGNTLTAGNTVIDTSSTIAGNSGGNVNLVAISNGATGGHILFPTTSGVASINTSGNANGNNGAVKIYAGAQSGIGISVGSIDTRGGTGAPGDIMLSNSQVVFAGGNGATCATCMSFDATGTASGGISSSLPVNSGTIINGPINAGAGDITVQAGGITTQHSASLSAATINLSTNTGSNGSISLNDNINATTSTTITADGSGTITDVPNQIAKITVGSTPAGSAINPAGTLVYVTNVFSNTVSVINTGTNSVVATIPVGVQPVAVILSPSGNTAYVANKISNTVTVINTTTNTVTATIPVDQLPFGIAIDPTGSFVYVANKTSNTVSVINTSTNTVTSTIQTPVTPFNVAVNPGGGTALVSGTANFALIIDTTLNKVVATIPLPAPGTGAAAYNASGTFAYIGTSTGVAVVNTATNQVVATGLPAANGVGHNPAGTQIYLVGSSTEIYNTSTNSYVSFPAVAGGWLGSSFVGYVGNNVNAYIPDTIGAVNVISTPSIVSPIISLSSATGNIDASVGNSATVAVNTSGSATINAKGNLTVASSNVGGAFSAGATGAINSPSAITSGAINFNAGINSDLLIGANLFGTNGVSLTTMGAGFIRIGNSVDLGSSNANIVLTGNLATGLSDTINAGTATVALQPNPMTSLVLTDYSALSKQITAGTLQIGSLLSGQVTQAGPLDVTGPAQPGVFNLSLLSGAFFNTIGSTTNIGSKTITIQSLGDAFVGSIIGGSGASINITAKDIQLVNGITAGASSSAALTETSYLGYISTGGNGGCTIDVPNVTLSAIAPDLNGQAANNVLIGITVSAANLVAYGSGLSTIKNTSAAPISFTWNGSGASNLTFSSNSQINLSSGGGGTVTISTSNNGIDVGGPFQASIINLTAATTGAITSSSPISALQVSLNSGSGDINATTVTSNLVVNTTGNVTVTNGSASQRTSLNLSSGGAVPSSLTVYNFSSLNTSTALNVSGPVLLQIDPGSTGNAYVIGLGANLTGSTVNLNALGACEIWQTAGVVTGSTSVTLQSQTGNIGKYTAGNYGTISVSTPDLSLSTSGYATIVSSSAVNLSVTGTNCARLSVSNDTGITTSGAITVAGTLMLTVTGNNGGISLSDNLTGSSVTLSANGSGSISQNAGAIISTTGCCSSISLSSNSGDITNLNTNTGILSLNTTGNVSIINAGAMSVSSGGATFASLSIAAGGNIGTTTKLSATSTISLTSSSNGGNIDIGSNLTGPTGITLTTGPSGVLSIPNGVSIATSNANIIIQTDGLNLGSSGTINAGTGVVSIAPASASTPINLAGGSGGLIITTAQLNNIFANTLVLGSGSTTGGITFNDDVDVSAKYNLQLLQGSGGITSTIQSLNVSSKQLIVNVGGSFALRSVFGFGFGSNIQITAGTITGPSITATNLTMTATNGNIGPLGCNVTSSISANATGDINIETGNGNLSIAANAGGSVSLMLGGSAVVLNGNVSGATGVSIHAASITVSGGYQILANNAPITLNTANLLVSGANPINAGANGTISILELANNRVINLGGVSSFGIDLSFSQLSSFTAGTLVVGTAALNGQTVVSAPWNVSSLYNLNFYRSDLIAAPLTLGNKTLTVTGGFFSGASFGTVSTSGTTISISSTNVSLNGQFGSANDNISITATTGTIDQGNYQGVSVTASNATITSVTGANLKTAITNNLILNSTSLSSSSTITNTTALAGFSVNGASFNLYNTGGVALSGPINATNSAVIQLSPGATLSNNGFQISANGRIYLVADNLNFTGTNFINANTGTVDLSPTSTNIPINIAGGSGGYILPSTLLNGITAKQVNIGSNFGTGIYINGTLDIAGKYNLYLQQGPATISSVGQTINLGSQSFSTWSYGALNLGPVLSSGATINLRAASATLTAPLGSATDNVTITAIQGSINSNSQVTAHNLTLSATGGDIILPTAASFLSAQATGNVAISNTGNTTLTIAGVTVDFNNIGNVNVHNMDAEYGLSISLNAGSTLAFTSSSGINSLSEKADFTADKINIGFQNLNFPIGVLTFKPTTNSTVINLGGSGSTGLSISTMDFVFIYAQKIVFGSNSTDGGINILAPLTFSSDRSVTGLQLLQGPTGNVNAFGNLISFSGAQPINFTVNAGGNVSLGPITTNGSTVQLIGSSISLSGTVGSSTDTTFISATGGDITSTGTIIANNLNLGAAGGNISLLSTVVGNNISANASGNITINNSGNLAGFGAVAGGTVALTNDGNVVLNGNVSGQSGVSLTLTPGNVLSVSGGNQILANNSTITLQTDGLLIGGVNPINAGSGGDITIFTPSSNKTINLGGISSNGIDLSIAQLASISAGTLTIGSPSVLGKTMVTGTLDVSSSYNLVFLGNDLQSDYLILGNKTLTVSCGSPNGVAVFSKLSSSGTTIQVTSAFVDIAGSFGSAHDNISITAQKAIIADSGFSNIIAKNLTLNSAGNSVVTTSVTGNLVANVPAPCQIFITNTGNLSGFSGSSGDILLTNTGSVGLAGTVHADRLVILTLSPGSTLSNNGFQITSNSQIMLTADSLNLTGPNPIHAGLNAGNGTIQITPATKSTPINIAGGSGGLVLPASVMSGILANSVHLGDTTDTGGITVNGPLDISGKYDLYLQQKSGTISSVGQTLTIGSQQLSISTNDAANLGRIISSGTTTSITAGSFTANDAIGSPTDTVVLNISQGNGQGIISAKNLIINSPNPPTGDISLVTAASNISANTPTNLTISNTGNLTLNAGVNSLSLNNVGNAFVNAFGNQISVSLDAGSTLTADHFQTQNGSISADNIVLSGVLIDCSAGTLSVKPTTNSLMINLGGGSSGLSFSSQDLALIRASTLIFGSSTSTGGVNLLAPLTYTGSNAPQSLQLIQGATGTVNSFGNTITLSGQSQQSLTISAGGAVNLGQVTTAGATVQVNGSNIAITGTFGSTGDTTTISSNSGDITSVASITAQNLALNATGGNIGHLTTLVSNSLSATATGNIDINNTGNLASLSGNAGGSLVLANSGNVVLGGNVVGQSGVNISLAPGNSLTIGSGSRVSSINTAINFQLDALNISGTNPINAGTSGTVTIIPATQSLNFNLGGTTGSGIVLSSAQLNSINAGTLTIGSPVSTGTANINSSIDISSNYNLQVLGLALDNSCCSSVLILGTKSLTVNNSSLVHLGSVSTSGSTIQITTGSFSAANVGSQNDLTTITTLTGDISGGTITAKNLTLLSAGNIAPLHTAVSNSLSASSTAPNSIINLTNNGNLANFTASGGSNAMIAITNNGNVSLGAPLTGPSGVSVSISPGSTFNNNGFGITSNSSIFFGVDSYTLTGATPLNAGAGTVTIAPATTTLAMNLAGGTGGLTITTTQLDGISAGTLILGNNQTGGINVNGPLDVSSKYNLQLLGGAGPINSSGQNMTVGTNTLTMNSTSSANIGQILSSGSTIKITGSTIVANAPIGSSTDQTTITATNGSISGSGLITAQNLTLNAAGGNIGNINTNVVGTLIANASGSVIVSSSGNLNLGSSAANAFTLNANGAVNITGNVTAVGAININAASLNTSSLSTTSGASISISNVAASPLTVFNAGNLTSTAGDISISSPAGFDLNISGGGNMGVALANSINLNATNSGSIPNMVHFTGSQSFTGSTYVNALSPNQSVMVDSSAVVTGHNALTMVTSTFINQGTVTGNPLTLISIGAGTIANSNGNIDLKNFGNNLTFSGKSLTILASGNIINTSTTNGAINLSSSSANGGGFNLIAGYNFAPATQAGGTPSPTSQPYTLGTTTGTPANITWGNVNINTSTTGAATSGGSVLAVATGSVSLGAINSSANSGSGSGGSITVIGNGISIGAVSTSALNSGNVSINSAMPQTNGTQIKVINGLVLGGSFVPTPGAFNGNIQVNAINAGNANITLATGGSGTISQAVNSTIATSGILSLTSGSKDISLNVSSSAIQLTTGSANASITGSIPLTLHTSSVGGNLSVNGTNGLAIGAGQSITAGGNLTLSNSGSGANINIGDNVVLVAGILTASGQAKLSNSPLVGLQTTAPSDIQKAGSISFQSAGATTGAVVNTISLGTNDQLISNGGDITFSTTKQNSNISAGDKLNLSANGGSININNFSGSVNLGLSSGGTNTTLTARTLNTFTGGNINITGSNGVRIGGGAQVNALGSLSLNAFNGSVDIAPATGGIINVGSMTNILANTGLSFGSNTSFNSANSINATIIGQNSQVTLGNSVSITAGALNAGAPSAANAQLSSSNIKSSGSIFITAIGTGGIIGGTSVSLLAEGGGINVNAVGQGGNLILGSGATLRADGGGINIFSAGTFNFGASGVSASGALTTRAVGPVGGSVNITASNGLTIGDNTQNVIAGSLFLTNIGTTAPGSLTLGTNSSTVLSNNGSAIINQLGQNSTLVFGNGSSLQSQGFMSVLALGVSAGKTINIGTSVRLESTGGGINVSSVGNGSFIVDNSSKVLADNGGINIFASGAMILGSTGSTTMTTGGPGGFMGIVAANGLSVGANSTISSSSGINITSLGSSQLVIGDGANILSGTAGSGGLNVFSAGPIVIGSTTGIPAGSKLSTSGVGGFLGLTSTSGLNIGSNSLISSSSGLNILGLGTNGVMSFGDNTQVIGAQFTNIQNLTNSGFNTGNNVQFTATGGLNLSQLGTGNFAFGTNTKILVNNGGLNLFTLNAASFGAGTTINTPSNFANLNIQAFTGISTGTGFTVTAAAGLLSITNIGAGKLQVGDGSTIVAGSGISLAAFNPSSDIEIGNSVAFTVGSNNSQNPPTYPNSVASGNVTRAGSISISAFGSMLVGPNNTGLSIGTNSSFTSNGGNISLSSLSQTGQVSIGDNYKFIANGGSINIGSGASGIGALTVGTANGTATSSMTALCLNSAAGSITFTAQGNLFVGAGSLNSGNATAITSMVGTSKISSTSIAAYTNLSIAGSTGLTVDTGATLTAGMLSPGAPASGNLSPLNISSPGSISLSSAKIIVGNNDTFKSNGGDLKVTANNLTIDVGTNNIFEANGGNIQMLAKGVVTVQSGNTFHARSVGTQATAASSTGGGIELGSGLTSSANLITAFSKSPGTNPSTINALGLNVVYTGNNLGVIQKNVSGAGVTNLNSTNASPSTLILNTGGAQVFDAQGSGSAVNVDNSTFRTEALRPIALLSPVEANRESLTSLTLAMKRTGTTCEIKVGQHAAKLRVFGIEGHEAIVPADESPIELGKQIAQVYASPKAQLTHSTDGLSLQKGELFINASARIRVRTSSAEIHALKGALASVRVLDGITYIRACGASGTVSAIVAGQPIALGSGEEMVISNHKPDDSEIRPSDGLGRRNTHTIAYGSKYVTISDFSIISMVSNHETLFAFHNSENSSEKKLLDRLLKTAATVDIVLKHRGAYASK